MDAGQAAIVSAGAGCAGAFIAILSLWIARTGWRSTISDRCTRAESVADQALKAVAELDNDVRDGAKKLEEDIRGLNNQVSVVVGSISLLREQVARDCVDYNALNSMETRLTAVSSKLEKGVTDALNHMTGRLDAFLIAKIGEK